MEYETGKRLEIIEDAIIELQQAAFPDRFEQKEDKKQDKLVRKH